MDGSLDRRQALKRGAVAGAVVWAAPVLTSVPASAQASVQPLNLLLNPSFEDGPPGSTIPSWGLS